MVYEKEKGVKLLFLFLNPIERLKLYGSVHMYMPGVGGFTSASAASHK